MKLMLKYLLDFLSGLDGAPSLQDPEFQQLVVDVQAGKAKGQDAFYENLEKIVNELKTTPEAAAFLKPVSKREAPDYHEVIKHPMDLYTITRHIKSHRYKNKADFARDLDLIWENCLIYNSVETHPLRAAARYMRQKAEHHLEYLQERQGRGAAQRLNIPGLAGSPTPSIGIRGNASQLSGPSGLGRTSSVALGDDEDADGESDDGEGEMEGEGANQLTADGRSRRATSVGTTRSRGRGASAAQPVFRDDRPNLNPSMEIFPALLRTPQSMSGIASTSSSTTLSTSYNRPGPSYSDKGKAKELASASIPTWYAGADTDEARADASWYNLMGKDEAYTSFLPAAMSMAPPDESRGVKRRRSSRLTNGSVARLNGHFGSRYPGADQDPDPLMNGNGLPTSAPEPASPRSAKRRPVSLEKTVHGAVESLSEARRVMYQIGEFQRIEQEGGVLPPIEKFGWDKQVKKEQVAARKRKRKEEREMADKRRKTGGEVGELEAEMSVKRASAGMLAHVGFDGANEASLDLFSRMVTEQMKNVGQTFRLLIDGFSTKMSPEEIILHALHENGDIRSQDLEAHIKDDIEREAAKIADTERKIKQAYKDVTTAPVVEDDMMFAENGEMLTDGNFADELGEDFLGLRDLGIAREHGMASLTVPTALFYGRRKRAAANVADKTDQPDFPPPQPFTPLNPNTYTQHVPALLHAFFSARLEAGEGLEDDVGFDPSRSQIGSYGQIIHKANPQTTGGGVQKKKVVINAGAGAGTGGAGTGAAGAAGGTTAGVGGAGDGGGEVEKAKKKSKPKTTTGVGKGNWVRPSKEEKERRAAEKSKEPSGGPTAGTGTGSGNVALLPQPPNGAQNGGVNGDAEEDAAGEEEDAEGEEE